MSSEEELVKQCANKNREAQKELFEKYASRMMGICIRYMSNTEDAKDVLQDGFVKVFMQIESFKFKSSLYTWMSRIFVNLCINRLNRTVQTLELTQEHESSTLNEENENQPIWGNLNRDQIMSEILALPDIYRVVINMYAIDGLTHSEIAKALNISEGSSKSRLSRARVILKERINTLKKS
ncbi:MAG: sigma-70 family RNA polymerase sigma factor [Bacteroidetes bacterium]|nr:sigma-70 family RNA polymerase sigma factor [Bacteroidota bacterium]